MIRDFDLLLVCINFRFHPYYLNIVKEMSDTYSVCLYFIDDKKQERTKETENLYINKCREYGADILRIWVAASDYAEDLRIDFSILDQHAESYRKVRNTFRFLLGNLQDKKTDLNFSNLEISN